MKNLLYATFLVLLLLSACTSDQKEGQKSVEFKNVNSSIAQSFSSLKTVDTFKIELTGRKPEDMILNFSIKNAAGKEIYRTAIQGTALLGSTDPNVNLSRKKDQIIFLKTIADEFFAEDNFLEPAVMPDDKPDQYTPDKALYEELKKTGLNGFKYRLGKENNIYIAWSEKEQRVKVYYNCC